MSKEWILNSAMNRWQLNFKRNVGAVSEAIRKCTPKSIEEWKQYYFANVYPEEHLEELGKTLYVKVTEVLASELESITEEDCIDYIKDVVIHRTFDGYQTEIKTIFGQLQQHIAYKIQPATDEWDRLFNVDFFIEVGGKFIGLQIKPVADVQLAEIYKERMLQQKTHEEFSQKFGGPVYYIFSTKKDDTKQIANPDVIPLIQQQIKLYESE